jgi:D-arabinose 1-dehydrogenase-like Zn-dependent alcohol dehydrogenase
MTMTTITTGERVRLTKTGWDEPLVCERADAAMEAPQGKLVVIEVEACGVCHRDLIDRAGRFPFQQVPITPGHEAVGRVVAIGPDVKDWKLGDRVATMHRDSCGECARCKEGATSLCEAAACVFGILADGGYAEHLVAPESAFFETPASLAAPQAAVMHCTFGTAYRDLVTLGRLARGERVLVTGANGGVGAAAIAIASRLDAEVVAIVRSDAHEAFGRSLGAHEVIVDAGQSFHTKVGRVDLVVEAVGVSTFTSSLRSLRLGGRMVVVGNIVPEKAQLNLGYIITNGISITGGSGATRREMAALFALHSERPFHIAIDRVLPLARAEEAQRAVKSGGLRGRVVLVPSRRA